MNATVRKWVVITGTMLAIVVGCNPTVTPVVDTGTGTDGLAVSDGGFSDAPVSPGGTGGVVDVGGDVGIDEVVITEDGGEETRSFFTAFQIDPTAEDTAGPKFVVAGYPKLDSCEAISALAMPLGRFRGKSLHYICSASSMYFRR